MFAVLYSTPSSFRETDRVFWFRIKFGMTKKVHFQSILRSMWVA